MRGSSPSWELSCESSSQGFTELRDPYWVTLNSMHLKHGFTLVYLFDMCNAWECP